MTSITTYKEITPTYLYIKQHSVTKKKYFGKTTKDPNKYLGSGHYWLSHIKKHGKQFVETIWLSDLYYDTSISEYAIRFSTENNIVESKDWANLIPENGLDGGVSGIKHSAETIAKRVAANKGYKHSEEIKTKISEQKKGKKLGSQSAESRAKKSVAHMGKTKSAEHRSNISAAQKGKKRGPRSEEYNAKISAKFFSLILTKKEYTKNSLSRYYPEFKQYY
jgi:hypothetical protein